MPRHPKDLTDKEKKVIYYLYQNGDAYGRRMASFVGSNASGVGGICARLERRTMVEEFESTDGTAYRLTITGIQTAMELMNLVPKFVDPEFNLRYPPTRRRSSE